MKSPFFLSVHPLSYASFYYRVADKKVNYISGGITMKLQIAQISSLEKIRPGDAFPCDEIHKKSVLAGQRLSYQLCIKSDCRTTAVISVRSELADCIKLYRVENAVMDMPSTHPDAPVGSSGAAFEDYITMEPGPMPDILIPLSEQQNRLILLTSASTVWVRADIPEDTRPGTYEIRISFCPEDNGASDNTAEVSLDSDRLPDNSAVLQLTVAPAVMPKQRLIYTRWFYADCIATAHNVPIYSEEHWALIDKYIAAAADVGINMILVPIHTPPLDTAVGTTRPCVQLVEIEKEGDTYKFSFQKFRRFIDICKNHGIQYFEMAHLFSQWGASCAPNIMVTENGKTDYLFGWHVAADSEEYTAFLKQYLAALSRELELLKISENTYFHISDEPSLDALDTYRKASEILRPLIGRSKTLDALSNYDFYEKGLVECPVTCVSHIHDFLEHEIENQWTYYCCEPQTVFPNCLLAMPSYRNRILGFLLYKYKIKGFLHWGFNFYNTGLSLYPIQPYLTTSGDQAFPSGDPFIVYPSRDGAYSSIRGEVTYDAIQDMNICFALESRIGRDAVVAMIDEAAGYDLRFDDYPKSKEFPEKLREQMMETLLSI